MAGIMVSVLPHPLGVTVIADDGRRVGTATLPPEPASRVAWAIRRAIALLRQGRDDEPAYIERSCVGGRQVLVSAGRTVTMCVGSDSSGRNGVFAFLPPDEAARVARRILRAIGEPDPCPNFDFR